MSTTTRHCHRVVMDTYDTRKGDPLETVLREKLSGSSLLPNREIDQVFSSIRIAIVIISISRIQSSKRLYTFCSIER